MSDYINAIRLAYLNGADVISISVVFTFTQPPEVTTAINEATLIGREGLGCSISIAAGNFSIVDWPNIFFPATHPNVIAVGSSTQRDEWSDFSRYGNELDVVGPGQDIISTSLSNTYNTQNGTSFATPLVAGLAGLILSINPCLNWQEVKKYIELGARKVGGYCYHTTPGSPNGSRSPLMGYGRIDAFISLQYAFEKNISYGSVEGVTSTVSTSGTYQLSLPRGLCSTSAGNYFVKRHEVLRDITYPYTPDPVVFPEAYGISQSNPNNGALWCEAFNITETSATLKTYLYEGFNINGQNLGYITGTPSNVNFIYTVMTYVPNIHYIQNKEISIGTNYYGYERLEAGSNVNPNQGIATGALTIPTGSDVDFQAGKLILLKSGFGARTNSNFHGYIKPFFQPCAQYPNGRRPLVYSESFEEEQNFSNFENDVSESAEQFPNPFLRNFYLKVKGFDLKNAEITIWSLDGKEVSGSLNWAYCEGDNLIETKTDELPHGVYFLKLKDGQKNKSFKIFKE